MKIPKVESYRFGHMVIDGESHNKDVIILPDRVIPRWWREEGHSLHPEDLESVLEALPEVLIVGQGAYSCMDVPSETRQAIVDAGIKLISLPTGEAWKRYNELREKWQVAAAFHLTC